MRDSLIDRQAACRTRCGKPSAFQHALFIIRARLSLNILLPNRRPVTPFLGAEAEPQIRRQGAGKPEAFRKECGKAALGGIAFAMGLADDENVVPSSDGTGSTS